MKHLLTLLILSAGFLFGQQAKPAVNAPAVSAPTAPTGAPPPPLPEAYLFDPQDKIALRDWQYQGDQMEIANQKMLLQVEKNKAAQAKLWDQMSFKIAEIAKKRSIDLTLYDFDAQEIKLVKKKPAGAK